MKFFNKIIAPAFSIVSSFMFVAPLHSIHAQDEFEKVQVLDHPRFSLTDRLVLDVDLQFLPLDAYYKPVFIEAAASYQWSDYISFEPVRFGYAFYNHDTGLKRSLERKIQNAGATNTVLEDQPLKDMKYHVGSAAYLNLLYSKSNFFNTAVVYHYWQLGSGISYYNMGDESQLGLDLILRARFFITESMTINIRGGHTIGFNSKAPQNITFLGMGVGFAF